MWLAKEIDVHLRQHFIPLSTLPSSKNQGKQPYSRFSKGCSFRICPTAVQKINWYFRCNKNEGLDLASLSEFMNKYVQKNFVPSKGHETLAGSTSYLGRVSSLVSQGIIIVKLQPHMLFMRQEGHFHEQLFLTVAVNLNIWRTQLPICFQLISELFCFRCLWKQTKQNDRVKQETFTFGFKNYTETTGEWAFESN